MNDSTWTWISGSDDINHAGVYNKTPDSSNVPAARAYAGVWFDSSAQELWIFGGEKYASSYSFGSLNKTHHLIIDNI